MKALDGMLGFAIGDAMGVPIEFMDREILLAKPVTKMLGYGNYEIEKGHWSDDTSMSLATMDSLTKCKKLDLNDMMKRFCKWVNDGEYSSTGFAYDIGVCTKMALIRYYNDKMAPLKCGGKGISENGNGSLMRMFPIAYFAYKKGLTNEQIEYLAITSSSITHAHEISTLSCYIYLMYINFILNGYDKYDSYNKLKEIDYSMFKRETLKPFKRILGSDISKLTIDDIKSTGYVLYTLEAVLWVILNTNNYAEAIVGAINLGGDTDTIGAITGSIAGLLYGTKSIPENWINDLKEYNYLQKMCSKFEASLK
ncbi:MAG: ADP-ribosylglycohydrolase family protein [Bacilli bacterium]|nr:ADP-ribosylglycohydrolase family protein [Bacilli bacterium]